MLRQYTTNEHKSQVKLGTKKARIRCGPALCGREPTSLTGLANR